MHPYKVEFIVDTQPMVQPIEQLVRKEILDGNFKCSLTGPEADVLFNLLKYIEDFSQLCMDTIMSHPADLVAAIDDLHERTDKVYEGTLHPALRRKIILIVKNELICQFSEWLGYVLPQ